MTDAEKNIEQIAREALEVRRWCGYCGNAIGVNCAALARAVLELTEAVNTAADIKAINALQQEVKALREQQRKMVGALGELVDEVEAYRAEAAVLDRVRALLAEVTEP